MKLLKVFCFVLVFLLAFASAAQADILDLDITHFPRVRSGDIFINYDADGAASGNGLFTASGYTY